MPSDVTSTESPTVASTTLPIGAVAPGQVPFGTYARVGLACQLQGNDADAEGLYLRSLAHQQSGEWRATPWTEVTLLNLAILYGRQGKPGMKEVLMEKSVG